MSRYKSFRFGVNSSSLGDVYARRKQSRMKSLTGLIHTTKLGSHGLANIRGRKKERSVISMGLDETNQELGCTYTTKS